MTAVCGRSKLRRALVRTRSRRKCIRPDALRHAPAYCIKPLDNGIFVYLFPRRVERGGDSPAADKYIRAAATHLTNICDSRLQYHAGHAPLVPSVRFFSAAINARFALVSGRLQIFKWH